MILSAGLSPAWQQILVFDQLDVGAVNRAREVYWCASGKVLNAGIAAHHLGGPSLTLAPIGGLTGAAIEADFAAQGVPGRWVKTAAASRVCTTLIDRTTREITELVENARASEPDELEAFCDVFAEEAARATVVVLIGSLPEGTPGGYYRRLLERVRCPRVLDFRGEGLLGVLDLEPELVKPNRDELEQTVGRSLASDGELLAAMRDLCRRGARWVLVTHGGGCVWLASESEAYRLQPLPTERALNPIGCGDAMAATVAWAMRDGRPMVESVRMGMAAARVNLEDMLPCRLDRSRIERLARDVRLDRVD
ncbi:MAG: 1-phosphofructokinase family hexose kinase [Planctomycetota bacterium]